jgi:O-antigen/teichoic acid export membrane protein
VPEDENSSTFRRWFGDESLKRIYRNAGTLIRGRAAAGIVSLGYMSLAAHTLGAEQFGILILLNVYALTVGELLLFPGWHSVIRYGSASLAENRHADFEKLVSFASLAELSSAVLSAAVAVALVPVLGARLGIPEDVLPMAMIYSLSAVSVARMTPASILYLFEKFNTLSLQQLAGAIVRLAGACIAYLADGGLAGFVAAWLIAHLAELVSNWAFALRELHRRGHLRGIFVSPRGASRIHTGLWRFAVTTKVDRSTSQLGTRIAPLSVGIMLEPTAVGLYHLALRLGMLLAQPAMVLGRTVYPELATLAANDDRSSVNRVTLRTGLTAGIAGIPFFLIFVFFGRQILQYVGGESFGAAYPVLIMIALGRIIHLLSFPLGSALTAIGRPGAALRVNMGVTLTLFPVLIGLLYWIGLAGAGIHQILIATATVIGLGAALWLRQDHADPKATGGEPSRAVATDD